LTHLTQRLKWMDSEKKPQKKTNMNQLEDELGGTGLASGGGRKEPGRCKSEKWEST